LNSSSFIKKLRKYTLKKLRYIGTCMYYNLCVGNFIPHAAVLGGTIGRWPGQEGSAFVDGSMLSRKCGTLHWLQSRLVTKGSLVPSAVSHLCAFLLCDASCHGLTQQDDPHQMQPLQNCELNTLEIHVSYSVCGVMLQQHKTAQHCICVYTRAIGIRFLCVRIKRGSSEVTGRCAIWCNIH
jgi:hypothetical protein